MTAQIANILKTILSEKDNGLDDQDQPKPKGLLFIDKIAGIVVVGEKVQPTDIEDAFAVTKFPISQDVDYNECMNSGCYKDLVPNSKLKGILYFEDYGTKPTPKKGSYHNYLSSLRLVCWINNKLIQGDNCKTIRHHLITLIRTELESKGYFNAGGFQKIRVSADNIIENDVKLFQRYTYPIDSVKFLMHPYEAFGIDLKVEYSISENCFDELEITEELC